MSKAVAPLFMIDAYKLAHRDMYQLAGNTTRVYSNFTNRGSRLPGVDKVVHFGLQAFIQKYLMDAFEPFFQADPLEVLNEYAERVSRILGIPADDVDTEHIEALHDLGYLPLKFSALPEGTRVPLRVPAFVVENTHPDFFWLPNYIESVMSASIWQASTSATIAHRMRTLLDVFAEQTVGDTSYVDFQAHDFSYRGMSSQESAQLSGAGHLLSFRGSDSLTVEDWVEAYYPGDNGFLLGSVPASEHSVMCAGIASVGEQEMFKRILNHYDGIVSVVSDSFDLWTVLLDFLPNLKDDIMEREGKLVIRPDSGDPVEILCGKWSFDVKTLDKITMHQLKADPEKFGVIAILYKVFGGTVNSKGFVELDPHVGTIYGDSINYDRANTILSRLREAGFAASNVVFGVGSFTYQFNTRDTFASAMKATWAEVDGKGVNLFKDPVTDNGTKRSATGRLAVLRDSKTGELKLKEKATENDEAQSLLQPVWEDGKFLTRQSYADVRNVLANQ